MLTAILILGLQPDAVLLGTIFFISVFIYGRDRIVDQNTETVKDPRAFWIAQNQNGIKLLVIGSGAAFAALAVAQAKIIPLLAATLFFSLSYTLPWLPGGKSFKKLPGFKTPFVAAMWATWAIGMPLVKSGAAWDANATALFAIFFLFMCTIVSINDVFDIHDDRSKDTKSLAVLFGETRTRTLSILFSLAGAAIGISMLKSIGLGISGLYFAGYATYVRSHRGRDHGPTVLIYRASSFVMLGLVWLLG